MPKCFDFFSKNLFFHHEHSTLYAYWERSVKNTYLVFQYICSSRERRPFRVLCDRHNVLVSKLFKFVQCSTFVHIFNSEALFDDDNNCPTLRGIAHKLFVKTELWFGDRCIRVYLWPIGWKQGSFLDYFLVLYAQQIYISSFFYCFCFKIKKRLRRVIY